MLHQPAYCTLLLCALLSQGHLCTVWTLGLVWCGRAPPKSSLCSRLVLVLPWSVPRCFPWHQPSPATGMFLISDNSFIRRGYILYTDLSLHDLFYAAWGIHFAGHNSAPHIPGFCCFILNSSWGRNLPCSVRSFIVLVSVASSLCPLLYKRENWSLPLHSYWWLILVLIIHLTFQELPYFKKIFGYSWFHFYLPAESQEYYCYQQ